MSFFKPFQRQEVRKPIQARTLNQFIEPLGRLLRLRAEPPLELTSTPVGMLLRFAGNTADVLSAGVTTSVITALSGTTPGTGTANFFTFNGTVLATGTSTPVYSIYTNAVPSGVNTWLVQWNNVWWILVYDC